MIWERSNVRVLWIIIEIWQHLLPTKDILWPRRNTKRANLCAPPRREFAKTISIFGRRTMEKWWRSEGEFVRRTEELLLWNHHRNKGHARLVFCEPLSVGRGSIGRSKCLFDVHRDARLEFQHWLKIPPHYDFWRPCTYILLSSNVNDRYARGRCYAATSAFLSVSKHTQRNEFHFSSFSSWVLLIYLQATPFAERSFGAKN